MATTQDVELDSDTGTVVVQNISVQDPDLVQFLEDHEPKEQVELVERAFRVGMKTLQLSETSKDLEYVKHGFEQMETSLQEEIDEVREERFGDDGEVESLLEEHLGPDGKITAHLEEAFGEDGKLVDRLDQELGEDGERIQEALDPDKDGSPTQRLKTELKDEIRSIRDKLTEEEARADERQDSWKGGDEFEDTVGKLLDDLAYNTLDVVEHTGDTEGEIPGRDVGDYVLELGETGQRIVVEAKSERGYTQPKIKDEMVDALENRDADYAIFVSECEEFVPDKVGWTTARTDKHHSEAERARSAAATPSPARRDRRECLELRERGAKRPASKPAGAFTNTLPSSYPSPLLLTSTPKPAGVVGTERIARPI